MIGDRIKIAKQVSDGLRATHTRSPRLSPPGPPGSPHYSCVQLQHPLWHP